MTSAEFETILDNLKRASAELETLLDNLERSIERREISVRFALARAAVGGVQFARCSDTEPCPPPSEERNDP